MPSITAAATVLTAHLWIVFESFSLDYLRDPGKLYWYDDAGQRYSAVDSYSGIRSDQQTQEA